jgi:selenocysteine lyase/cysteine desulfurase
MDSHFMPGDTPADTPYTWELSHDASGHFETGTHAIGVAHVLTHSLPYIRKLGVANIEAYRQPLLQRLHQEMPRLGFEPLTPPESKSALITFAVKDREAVQKRLAAARINARLGAHFIRLSPSVFNDMKDIEKLLEALS